MPITNNLPNFPKPVDLSSVTGGGHSFRLLHW